VNALEQLAFEHVAGAPHSLVAHLRGFRVPWEAKISLMWAVLDRVLTILSYTEMGRGTAQVTVLTGKNITQLAIGGSEQVDSHTLAIVEPGKLYATGDNTYGQLVRAGVVRLARVCTSALSLRAAACSLLPPPRLPCRCPWTDALKGCGASACSLRRCFSQPH
jgi:hypothetical protein